MWIVVEVFAIYWVNFGDFEGVVVVLGYFVYYQYVYVMLSV